MCIVSKSLQSLSGGFSRLERKLTLLHGSWGGYQVFLSRNCSTLRKPGRYEKQTTRIGKQSLGRHHVLQAKFMRARDFVEVQELCTRDALRLELLERSPRGVGHEPAGIEDRDAT